MIRFLTILGLVFLCFNNLKAQDIHFSQYDYAPLNLNPALTGLFAGHYRGAFNYRSQWFSVPVPYRTISGSFDASVLPYKLEKDVWGAGLTFNYDQAGDSKLSNMQFLASTAFAKYLTKGLFLSAGVQLGFGQRRFKLDQLTFDDQFNGDVFDPNIQSVDLSNITQTTFFYFDIGAGMNLRYQASKRTWVNVGGSLFHLNRPNYAFMTTDAKLSMRLALNASASIQVHSRFDIMPTFLYQYQKPYQEIVFGSSVRYHLNVNPGRETAIYLGGAYRWDDAAILMLGLNYQTWHFGFSYDINTSPFKRATNSNGGFEISLIYIWNKVPELGAIKTCPVF